MNIFKTKKKTVRLLALALMALLSLAACQTQDVTVEEGTSPEKIMQLAQEASDNNRFEEAKNYYQVLLERFPDDLNRVVPAKYEIAFIMEKQGDTENAATGYREVLSYYTDPSLEKILPQWTKVLAEKKLRALEKTE